MKSNPSTRLSLVDLALIFTAAVWGVNVVVVKIALQSFDPIVFNSLRFALAAILSWALLLITEPNSRPRREDLFTLGYLGLLGHTLYQVLFIYGISFTTAGNTSLLLATMPVWVAMFSVALSIDTVRVTTWLGLACSILGILLVVLGSGKALGFARETLRGDLMIIAGTLLYAFFTIRSRPLLAHYTPLQVTTYTMTSGTLALALVATPTLVKSNFVTVSFAAWGALLFSGVFAIVIGYYIWNSGVKILGPARTAIYSNLSPIVAMLAGWVLLEEALTLRQFTGAAFIILGLLVARMRGNRSISPSSLRKMK
ncbi:MAG: hypothetical protein FD169_1528 [Bacillota bacterium]|nr:MAG: hypothetical protein FD169_1528 [Bacillota bacterium]MBS3949093.1 DMT family transporter [Peptococcaceae bacterium]